MRSFSELLTIDDFEKAAAQVLPNWCYDYFREGADREWSVARSRSAYDDYEIWARVLEDVSACNTQIQVLGETLKFPVIIAPAAYQKLAHPDGEIASAKAAAEIGTIFTLSTLSTISLEDVAASCSGPKWFQTMIYRDRGLTQELVQRAQHAGYKALVITVDQPVLGRRFGVLRNKFLLPLGMVQANLISSGDPKVDAAHGLGHMGLIAKLNDPSLTLKDLEWLRKISPLPIVIKGVIREDDAARLADFGVEAIVVSTHGARQLDGVPATIDALAGVTHAVGGRCDVLMDGGVRWGTDVLKAIGLGAKAVLIGRPTIWGLAVGGQAGVSRILEMLREELTHAMILAGCSSLESVRNDIIRRVR